MDLVHQGKVCDATARSGGRADVILLTASRSGNSGTGGTAPKPGLAGVLSACGTRAWIRSRASWTGSSPWARPGWRRRAARMRRPPRSRRRRRRPPPPPRRSSKLRRELGATASALQRADPTSRASVVVATALLRCVPLIAPEEWRGGPLGEAVPPLCAHPRPAVRAAARDAMRRAVASTPAARDAMCRASRGCYCPSATGRAGISLTDADAATSAARTLRDVCETWRDVCETRPTTHLATSDASARGGSAETTFDPSRSEAAGLLMMCSPHAEVRVAAVEMLREVAKLSAALRHASDTSGGVDDSLSRVLLPSAPSMSSIVESHAGDMVLSALGAEGGTGRLTPRRPASARRRRRLSRRRRRGGGGSTREGRRVDGGARRPRRSRLRVEPDVTTTARAQALQRVQAVMAQEGAAAERRTGAHSSATDTFEAAQLHVFRLPASPARETGPPVLSASNASNPGPTPANPLLAPQQVPLGVRGSLSGLFALLVPCLKEGGAQAAAAAGSSRGSLARRAAAPRRPRAAAGVARYRAGQLRRPRGGHAVRQNRRDLTSRAPRGSPPRPRRARGRRRRRAGSRGRDAVAEHLLFFVDSTVSYARSTGAAIECSPTSSTGCCSPPPPPPPPRRRRSWPWRRTSWIRRFGPGSGRTFTLWGPRGRRRASG